MLDTLTVEDFEPLTGQDFALREPKVALRLERVARVMESERARLNRQPFSLYFRGPLELHLPQQIYVLEHTNFAQPLEIFLVPVGRNDAGFEYEAVFS